MKLQSTDRTDVRWDPNVGASGCSLTVKQILGLDFLTVVNGKFYRTCKIAYRSTTI